MRCLTLADELRRHGAEVVFVCAELTGPLADRIIAAGHGLERIDPASAAPPPGISWDSAVMGAAAQRLDAQRTLAVLGGRQPNWVIVDHYRLDREWDAATRSGAARVAVIDDLANRPHDCDLLHDQTVGRDAAEYRPLVPEAAELLVGSHYALLRPEFEQARPQALERRGKGGPVRRILVSLGLTDVGGMTPDALEQTLAGAPDVAIDVVLGSAAPSLHKVKDLVAEHPRVALHVDSTQMASLMLSADLAIGAAGTSSWERCCLGLPTVTLVLAPNQGAIAEKLADAGAVHRPDAPGADGVGDAVRRLLTDEAYRSAIADNALRVCDGGGTRRVAERLLAPR